MRSKFLGNEKGASMVEMAIVLPLLFMILFAIIEISLILYDKAMLTNASREGARLGVVYRLSGPGTYSPPTRTEILNRIDQYLRDVASGHEWLISFSGDSYSANVTPSNGCPSSGANLLVTVTYDYHFLVLPNFITSLFNPIQLKAVTTMVCE
jgi:hypothetical protein